MKASEIKVGGRYTAKVSNRIVTVRVDGIREAASRTYRAQRTGETVAMIKTVYDVTNLATHKKLTFKSAAKFRKAVEPQPLNPPPDSFYRN